MSLVPGLLLSFAARLDAAKTLVALVSGGDGGNAASSMNGTGGSCCWGWLRYSGGGGGGGGNSSSSYFIPLVVAYAIGLGMANIAVYVMEMGQPALLYLVPCCLGTMSFLGWKRQELRQLWEGPKVLDTAEQIVFGPPASTTAHSQVPSSSSHNGTRDARTVVELSPKTSANLSETGGSDQYESNPNNEDDDDDEEVGHVPLLQPQNENSPSPSSSSGPLSSSA